MRATKSRVQTASVESIKAERLLPKTNLCWRNGTTAFLKRIYRKLSIKWRYVFLQRRFATKLGLKANPPSQSFRRPGTQAKCKSFAETPIVVSKWWISSARIFSRTMVYWVLVRYIRSRLEWIGASPAKDNLLDLWFFRSILCWPQPFLFGLVSLRGSYTFQCSQSYGSSLSPGILVWCETTAGTRDKRSFFKGK